MAELTIARINEQGIQARDLSETFSGEHEIIIKGQQSNAGGQCVALLNGISLVPSQTKGLNCIHLIDNIVQTRMNFDFSISSDTTRFKNWLNGLTQGIVLMVSHTENNTNTELNTYFDSIGSVGWKYYWDISKGTNRSSYAAIFDCPLKKLLTEQFMGSGSTTPQAYISVVFDTYADIGTTGYGDTPIWDESEFISNTIGYNVKSFFTNTGGIREPIANYNMKIGETFELKCELMHDSLAVTNGVYAAMYIQFYTATDTFISSFNANTLNKTPNIWHNFNVTGVIPANASKIELNLYRFPNNANSIAGVGCRDVVFKLKKPSVNKQNKMGTFGQWGFITSNANESSDVIPNGNISGTSVVNNFIAHSYDTLDQEFIPRLSGNESFTLPQYDITNNNNDFEYTATLSFDYPSKNQLSMLSGDSNMYVGINTILHASGESHILKYGSYSAIKQESIEYNRSYTYKINVVNNTPIFSIDGVILPTLGNNLSIPVSFPNLSIGSIGNNTELDGSVHEVNLIDRINESNTRIYNFILAGDLSDNRKLMARSRYAGLEYQLINVNPTASSSLMYAGIGSGICPYGVSVGDVVYVTIRSFGGQTPVSGLILNKKYRCTATKNINSNFRTHTVHLKNDELDITQWIQSGQISNLICDVQYTANPYINADVNGDINWYDVNVNTAPFNGDNYIDIPPVGNAEFSFKFNMSSNGGYLLEGRSLLETNDSFGGCYISSGLVLTHFGNLVIGKVNGVNYTSGMTITKNTDYHITGYISGNGRINRIGARYNDVEYFSGNIWDITIDNNISPRYYKNLVKSRYDIFSNCIRNDLADNITLERTSDLDLNQWSKHDNVTIDNKKSFKINIASTATGVSKSINGKVRIDFDITSETPIQLLNTPNINGAASVIKSLPAGRSRGSIIYDAIGIYIRVINPILNQKVIISKFNVVTSSTDGIIANSSSNTYKYNLFDDPVMKTSSKLKWVPIGGNNLISIDNPWKPIANNWKARIKCKLDTFSDVINPILGHTVTNNAIVVDQSGTNNTIRLYRYDANGIQRDIIQVVTNKSIGSIIDININVIGNICTLSVDGITSSGIWGASGNEVISLIGGIGNIGFSSIIYSVDLIDSTSTLGNDRIYNFIKYSSVQPNINTIPNDLSTIRYIRTDNLPNGDIGFLYDGINTKGKFKDTRYINGYQIAEIRTLNNVNYSAYIKFENNIRPFNTIILELYSLDEYNNEKLYGTYIANQSIDNIGYGVPFDDTIKTWLSEVGATRKIIFKPDGQGAMVRFNKSWINA